MKNRTYFLAGASLAILLTFGLFSFKLANKPATKTRFLQITAIESVVPGGLGRSRMITMSPQGKMEEVKLENFFSLVGINFENVRSNDRDISAKIEQLYEEGWELVTTNTGVYSSAESTGIFITRYLFKKQE